jgi:hypothetical protein
MGVISEMAALKRLSTIDFVKAAIEEHGSVPKAAAALGVNPEAIKYWLRKYNLRVVSRRVVRVEPRVMELQS